MTITRCIVDLLKQRGPGTVDDLLPHIPGVDRHRLMRVMQDAKTYGTLRIVRRAVALGRGQGSAPAVYDVAPKLGRPGPARVKSVWELGQC